METINDVVKTNIKTRLEKALESEDVKIGDAARILGVLAQYLSMIKNTASWEKVSKGAWDSVLTWINSGQTLKEYSERHGKVLPSNHEPKPGAVISRVIEVKPMIKAEDIKAVLKSTPPRAAKEAKLDPVKEFTDEARLKVSLDIEINLVLNGKKLAL